MRFIPKLEALEDRNTPSFLTGSFSGSILATTSYYGGSNLNVDYLQGAGLQGRLNEPGTSNGVWYGSETFQIGNSVYVMLLQGTHTRNQLGIDNNFGDGGFRHTAVDTVYAITVFQAGIWKPHYGVATLTYSAPIPVFDIHGNLVGYQAPVFTLSFSVS